MYPSNRVKNDGTAIDVVEQAEFDAAIAALQLGSTATEGTTTIPSIIIGASDLFMNDGDMVIANQLNVRHVNIHGVVSQNTTDDEHATLVYYDTNGLSLAGMGTNLIYPAWYTNSWSYDSANLYNIIAINNDAVAANRSVEIDAPLTVKGMTCGSAGISLFTGAINSSHGNINVTNGTINLKDIDVHAKLIQLENPRPAYIGADRSQHAIEIDPTTNTLTITGGGYYNSSTMVTDVIGRLTVSEGLNVNLPTTADHFSVNTNGVDRFVVTSDGDILYSQNPLDPVMRSLRLDVATLIDGLAAEKSKVSVLEGQMVEILARLSGLRVLS
jgi:hypothetical protein